MSLIDNFIGMMAQRNIERAVLVNDRPGHLFSNGADTPGPIIPGAQLQSVIQEVAPESVKAQLASGASVHFPYQSPHGAFEIGVQRLDGTMQVSITPAAAAPDMNGAAVNGAAAPAVNGAANGAAPTEASEPTVATGPKKKIGHIDELFRLMQERDASDLHLSSDEHPVMRIQGIIKKLEDYEINTHEDLKRILWAICPERNREQWEDEKDTDFAYELGGLARFRCNYFSDRKGIGAVFRLIPSEVLTAEQLHLEKAIMDLCYLSKGLVVVTGPTGSGKSTTLAAMIDHINKHRDDHIITIEDPVEFVHHNIKCLINQREVHVHTESFKRALRAALREDPDIVLVGEMRDLETIAIAIETAETGHLVFGTLHTTTAPSTVDRIIDQFPADQQAQIRVMLSESLKGVIAQTLLRTVDGKRVAAHEILLVPSSVGNLIREGKTFQLPSQMQMGKSMGMLTMNDSIMEFVKSGRVHPHEGYVKSVDKIGLLGSYEANGIDYSPGEAGNP